MVASKLMTASELLALSDDERVFELIEGEAREVSPSSGPHSAVGMNIAAVLAPYVRARNLGQAFGSDAGFVLRRDPDTVLSPDLAFLAQERIPEEGLWEGFVPMAPDLAVEVASPSNTLGELLRKVALYLEGGARLVWLVRPETRTVTVFRPGAAEQVLHEGDALSGHDVLPGLSIPLAEVFLPRGQRGAAPRAPE